MASFAPAGGFQKAIELKDGLLGAAIGWYLRKRRIRFWHSRHEKGTEMDFVVVTRNGSLLIECKILSVLTSAKQLARNVREGVKQLDEHAALLENQGMKLGGAVCVLNLTDQDLATFRKNGRLLRGAESRVVSYERFTEWLRQRSQGSTVNVNTLAQPL